MNKLLRYLKDRVSIIKGYIQKANNMAAGLHAEAVRLQVSSYMKHPKENKNTSYNVGEKLNKMHA